MMSHLRIALGLLSLALAGAAPASPPDAPLTSYAVHNGVRIAYEVSGEGEPLVLIPGISQSRGAWEAAGFVEAFVRSGRKVITVDPRGHGDSDKPHDPAAYEANLVADDIISVLDALRIEKADLLGYSRGGWIAMSTAIRYPRRVRLVVAGGAHPYAEDLAPFRRAFSGELEQWVALIERRVGALPENARAMFLANDVHALRAAVAADRADVSRALVNSGVSLLLYAGSEDPRAPLALRFAQSTPRAEYLEIPGQDHFQAFFNPDRVAEAVDMRLRELAQGTSTVARSPLN